MTRIAPVRIVAVAAAVAAVVANIFLRVLRLWADHLRCLHLHCSLEA